MRARPKAQRVLTDAEHRDLQALARRRKTAQAAALRARIVLACAEGIENNAVAARLRVTQQTVSKWHGRFVQERLDGLWDAPRSGAPRTIDDARVEAVVAHTLESKPLGATHWSTRSMAREMGMTQNAVLRIWHAFGLQPHRRRPSSCPPTRCPSTRYARSSVCTWIRRSRPWCCAWTRRARSRHWTARSRGPGPARAAYARLRAPRHDHTVRGAGRGHRQGHRADAAAPSQRGIPEVLRTVEVNVPAAMAIHLVMDNDGTHKTDAIKRWLLARPRFHVHFTPTSAAWLNQVERWFATLTERCIRRGRRGSTQALERSIRAYVELNNQEPRPFCWTQTADEILASIERFCLRTSRSGH